MFSFGTDFPGYAAVKLLLKDVTFDAACRLAPILLKGPDYDKRDCPADRTTTSAVRRGWGGGEGGGCGPVLLCLGSSSQGRKRLLMLDLAWPLEHNKAHYNNNRHDYDGIPPGSERPQR